MAPNPRSKPSHRAQLAVGDRVAFQLGGRRVVGTVIEDRGKIGFKRARLLAVRVRRSEADDLILEMPADELRAA